MADNEVIDGTAVRGNEWEVVSLTASAYAAAPGSKEIEKDIEEKSNVSAELEGESSQGLFMSRHFAYPVNENIPIETDESQMQTMDKDEDLISEPLEEGYQAGNQSFSNPEFEASKNVLGPNMTEKDGVVQFSSLRTNAAIDEKVDSPDFIKSSERGSNVTVDGSEVYTKNERSHDESNLPCEAWWKKQASSLYAQAKETNTFWSIFIAAAVMGLVFIGNRWRKERRQILQIKWHVAVKDEKSGRVLQPISLLKNIIVGGSRANSFTHGAPYDL